MYENIYQNMPNYLDFMEKHRWTDACGKHHTHTRIPNKEYNIYGGKKSGSK